MHGAYERLEREGQIGPFMMKDGKLQARPHQEYPKWVTTADGSRVIVKDLTEEARVAGEPTPNGAADPLGDAKAQLASKSEALDKERAELEELKAQMKASLAELEVARAGVQGSLQSTKGEPTAAPVVPVTGRPQGSTYRLPKEAQQASPAVESDK